MRRWFLMFLLFVLPMQFAFAGAANCHQLRAKPVSQNVLQAPDIASAISADSAAQDDESDSPGKPLSHCECSACHFTGAQPAPGLAVLTPALQKDRLIPQPAQGLLLDVARLIDRPNWSRAV